MERNLFPAVWAWQGVFVVQRSSSDRMAGWPVRVKESGNQGARFDLGDRTHPKWLFPPHFHLQTSADGGAEQPLCPSRGTEPSQRPCCSLTSLILVAEWAGLRFSWISHDNRMSVPGIQWYFSWNTPRIEMLFLSGFLNPEKKATN